VPFLGTTEARADLHYDRGEMRARQFPLVFALFLLPSTANAQPANQAAGMYLYGISAGVGERSTSGTLHDASLPPNVGQPPSSHAVGVLDLSGGFTFAKRLGALALLEQAGGADTATGNWGTLGIHGVVRAWVAPRVWVEGGVGSLMLGYRPPSGSGNNGVTRLWTVSPEISAGGAIFQGEHVAIDVIGRYVQGAFDDFAVRHFSVQIELLGRGPVK
jgi:hypothetical protein